MPWDFLGRAVGGGEPLEAWLVLLWANLWASEFGWFIYEPCSFISCEIHNPSRMERWCRKGFIIVFAYKFKARAKIGRCEFVKLGMSGFFLLETSLKNEGKCYQTCWMLITGCKKKHGQEWLCFIAAVSLLRSSKVLQKTLSEITPSLNCSCFSWRYCLSQMDGERKVK